MTRKRAKPDDETPLKLVQKERVDMAADLVAVREALTERGYRLQFTDAAGEVWQKPAPPWRVSLLSDPDGTLRAEIRNPAGLIHTEVRPARAEDVEQELDRL